MPAGHARALHWDLMLEWGEGLRTWALASLPQMGAEIAAEELPAHRLAYLDYEGPVSGDRGTVTRWDRGTYSIVHEAADRIEMQWQGSRVAGRAVLTRGEPGAGEPGASATGVLPGASATGVLPGASATGVFPEALAPGDLAQRWTFSCGG